MKTLKLINHIFQNPEITIVEFVSTSINSNSDDKRLSPIEAIEYLSSFFDCEDTEWHVNRLGNEFVAFSN